MNYTKIETLIGQNSREPEATSLKQRPGGEGLTFFWMGGQALMGRTALSWGMVPTMSGRPVYDILDPEFSIPDHVYTISDQVYTIPDPFSTILGTF